MDFPWQILLHRVQTFSRCSLAECTTTTADSASTFLILKNKVHKITTFSEEPQRRITLHYAISHVDMGMFRFPELWQAVWCHVYASPSRMTRCQINNCQWELRNTQEMMVPVILSLSLICVAVTAVSPLTRTATAISQLYCMHCIFWLFYHAVVRANSLDCIMFVLSR